MSLSRLRHDLLGASSVHRAFVLLAVVAALVVGLLAMHTINTFASHSMTAGLMPAESMPARSMSAVSMPNSMSSVSMPSVSMSMSDAVSSNGLLSNVAGHDVMAVGSATVVVAMVSLLHGESTDPMAAMACVLAILFTVIALVAVRGQVVAARLAPRDGVDAAMEVALGASADHPPPDLHVLSISRV